MDGARPVRAARGTTLTARSWQTEAPLRMLQNNLDPEVAERPDDLVVYGGSGKAARNWPAYEAIVAALTGGDLLRAVLIAAGCFFAATAWSWWRLRTREAREEQ